MTAYRERYFLLVDPARPVDQAAGVPPFEAVLGVWPLRADGGLDPFRPNPDYEPLDPDAPTDPIDATLRAATPDDHDVPDRLRVLLRDCLVDVATGADGEPTVADSPDGVPCLLITTSASHRRHVPGASWLTADLDGLVTILDDGVDLLVNPGAPGMARLPGDLARSALGLDAREARELLQRTSISYSE